MLGRGWRDDRRKDPGDEIFYISRPYYAGLKTSWFPPLQGKVNQRSFFGSAFSAPASLESAIEGAYDGVMRPMRKRDENIPDAITIYTKLRGKAIEQVVVDYFAEHYPEFFRDPDNKGKRREGASHDFKLQIAPGRLFHLDVFGRDDRGRGVFCLHPDKKLVDYHIAVEPLGSNFVIRGIFKKRVVEQYRGRVLPLWRALPAKTFLFELNCYKHHIDYQQLLKAAPVAYAEHLARKARAQRTRAKKPRKARESHVTKQSTDTAAGRQTRFW
jgi:hypothetical protein